MWDVFSHAVSLLPRKYQGIPSTILISGAAVFLAIWSSSTMYLLSPLWLVPLFILRSPKSDRRALQCFVVLEPVFRVNWIKKKVGSAQEWLLPILFLVIFAILAVCFFLGDVRPTSWLTMLGYALIGALAAGIAAYSINLALGTLALTGQILLMLAASVGIRTAAIVVTFFLDFPYTVSRMFENYRRITLSDGLVRKLELAPKVSLFLPQYSSENFAEEIRRTTADLFKEADDLKIASYQIALHLTLALYFLGNIASLLFPSLLPRICVKISSVPLAAIFLRQPKHFRSKERGRAYFQELREDRLALIVAITIIAGLSIVHFSGVDIVQEYLAANEKLLHAADAVRAFFFSGLLWIWLGLASACSVLISLITFWIFFIGKHIIPETLYEGAARLLSAIGLGCASISVVSMMASPETVSAFQNLW